MKLYRNLLFLLLIVMVVALTGCDFFGGDADNTAYHLTLKFSSNVASKAGFDQSELKATFAGGERHDVTERPQDEIDELLSDGAKQEDIDKTNKRQPDGSYYFFAGDPIIVTAPQPEGYIFVGFYDKNNNVYRPIVSQHQLSDGSVAMLMNRWNMLDEDCELEARYQVLEYDVTYCYGFDSSKGPTGKTLPSGPMSAGNQPNTTHYNYDTKADVTLSAPTVQIEGMTFKYWFYYTQGTGEPVIVTSLPKEYEESVLHGTVDANGISNCELTLFAHYEVDTCEVTVIDNDEVVLTIEDTMESTTYDISSGSITVTYGTKITIRVDNSEMPAGRVFEGIYIDDVKVPDLDIGGGQYRPLNVYDLTVTNDCTVEIKTCDEQPQ